MNNILSNYIISFVAFLISVSLGLLTGIDEVRNGIILSFIFHWLLFIPLVYFLGITLNMGYWGAWIGFASHLTFIAAFTILRLKSGKWKEVIL